MSSTAQQRFMRLAELVRSGRLAEADPALSNALRTTPKDPNLLHLMAELAERKGEWDKSALFYRRALTAHPGWMEATLNLARLLGRQKKEAEAVGLIRDLTVRMPERADLWEALARFQQGAGFLGEAVLSWRESLRLQPHNPAGLGQYYFCCRQICDWSDPPVPSPDLPPAITTILFDDPALQKESATRFVHQRLGNLSPMPPAPDYKHERLRIGYLSSDFHAHATSYLMAELFSLHNRFKFEVFVYSYGIEDHSPIRKRLREEAEHFVELNTLTPLQCAQRIRADEIDLLIDLKGHTQGGRLDILAARPAPHQVHWLGFPGTIGAPFLDGFIADSVAVPEGAEGSFSEKIWRLSHCYQINDRQKRVGPPQPKSAYGLPDDALVLASYNQTYKITPDLFALWCRLLKSEPRAILLLYESNSEAPAALRQAAEQQGVDPARLFFAKPAPLEEHLARYRVVDLALDTYPVGGHTTTSDALWVGTPVITLAGKSFVSRVAASLLTAAQQEPLIATTLEAYEALALKLMNDATARQAIKAQLEKDRLTLPLFDTPRFVKDLEALYLEIVA